jgi:hypothetical protein
MKASNLCTHPCNLWCWGGQEIYDNVLANRDVTIGAIGNVSGNL